MITVTGFSVAPAQNDYVNDRPSACFRSMADAGAIKCTGEKAAGALRIIEPFNACLKADSSAIAKALSPGKAIASTPTPVSSPLSVNAVSNANNNTSIANSGNQIKPPALSASSMLIVDEKTGTIIWRKNANQPQHIASTTKIMTAIVALERCSLDETVTVRRDVVPAGKEGGIKLVPGEQMKLRDLMYALLLYSANDAAVAIADHVAGSETAFAGMMNRKAAQLRAARTHFVNPHGLDNRLHYSTVGDLAIFARYAMKNPEFAKIVGTKNWILARSNPKLPCKIENTNLLLTSYYGTFGVKTGYTKKARNCLVSGAKRGDTSLICVVLGVKDRKNLFKESAALLDFGFRVQSLINATRDI
jgi:D-alanyl-D-alanine carboxypeptidase